jgi:hypothetical protein
MWLPVNQQDLGYNQAQAGAAFAILNPDLG